MAKKKSKPDQITQQHVDRWADLMKRIIKNPEIADRIPNHANILFGQGDLIFINGEPRSYNELVKARRLKK
jgi:hypothetical protein